MDRKRIGRRLLRVLLPGILVVLAACGGGQEDQATRPASGTEFAGSIKLGVIYDATGPVGGSPITLSQVRGLEKGVESVNNKGGVTVGGQRYRLELIKVDSRSEAVAAVAAAQEVIQKEVIGSGIATCPSFDQVYQQLRVAGILAWTNCPPGLNQLHYQGAERHPLLFAIIDFTEPIIVGWMKMTYKLFPDIKRVSFLLDDGQLGRAMAPIIEKGAKDLGLEFVGGIHFPAGTTDYSAYITNVRARRPDMVYAIGAGAAGFLELPQQAAQLNLAPYVMVPGMRPVDIEKLGDIRSTIFIMVDWRLPYHKGMAPPEYASVVDSLGQLETGAPLQVGFAIANYDWAHLLAKAIEKAGTTKDPAAIAKALPGLTTDSLLGGQSIVQPDHSTIGPTGIIVATRDKFTVYTYKDARQDTAEKSYVVPR